VSERYELPPERLGRWLERWTAQHGLADTRTEATRVTYVGTDGARVVCLPPFPPLSGPLLEHVARERRVGVLLVRLGAHAAGIFEGRRLVSSKVDRRLVHGRHRAGGSSARRFERRRDGQARESLRAAADLAARVLAPEAPRLDAVVAGGDRSALGEVLRDRRLTGLRDLLVERVLEVPEPRLDVLRATPDAFRSTVVMPYNAPES
jgi:peptide subunit release factor 1 (eRF1)